MKNLIGGFALLLSLASPSVFAGGSVSFEDVVPVLEQKPDLYKVVQGLDVGIGTATRLGNQTNFGGARIGPYVFPVKTRDAAPVEGTLIIITRAYATNGSRHEVELTAPDATELHEDLKGIELKLGETE
jgi:hypothetical protein